MNKTVKRQNEEQVRRWVRNIIREDRQYRSKSMLFEWGGPSWMSPEEAYDTWVAPFANVFKVAKVAVKDITSSVVLNLELLTTFDPDKMEKQHAAWGQRKNKIDQEYSKVMEPINKALESGDTALVGFMLNPAGFLGAGLVAKGISNTPAAVEYLQDAGFDMTMASALVGGNEPDKEPDDPGVIGGTLKALAKLFFIAHHAPDGAVLLEAEEDKESKGGDLETGMEGYLDELGILDKIESDAMNLVKAKIEIIEDTMNDARAKFAILDGLYRAEDAPAFKAAIDKANSSGLDIGGGGIAALGKELQANVDKMLKDPDTKNAMALAVLEAKGKKIPKGEDGESPELPEEVNEEELIKHVEQIVFMQSKTPLQKKIFEGVKQMADAALKVVMEDVPPEDDWDMISASPAGQQLIDAVKNAVKEIKN